MYEQIQLSGTRFECGYGGASAPEAPMPMFLPGLHTVRAVPGTRPQNA